MCAMICKEVNDELKEWMRDEKLINLKTTAPAALYGLSNCLVKIL